MAKQSTSASTRRTTISATRSSSPSTRRTPGTRRKASQAGRSDVTWNFPLAKPNLIGIGIGLVLVVIGYLCMSTGMVPMSDVASNEGIWNNSLAVTVAPILLVLGYCVVIPFSIIYRFGRQDTVVADESGEATEM